MREKQTYKYVKANSILVDGIDEYDLTQNEYYRLYSFYVTFSMCGNQSEKKKTLIDYGWMEDTISKNTQLKIELQKILNLNRNDDFIFTEENVLREKFEALDLNDGALENIDKERAVIGHTNGGDNYLKLFYRVRDGLAHGKFVLKLSSNNEKMIIMQDNDRDNVTGRIVIKLNTLLDIIKIIDKVNLIN